MAVTVRLDSDALRALRALEASGLSRSDAVRQGLIRYAEQLRGRSALRAEVESLRADADDQREMREVAAFMESMRAPR